MLSALEQPQRTGFHPFHRLNKWAENSPSWRKTGLWLRYLLPLAIAPSFMGTLFMLLPGVSTYTGLLIYMAVGGIGGEGVARAIGIGLKMAEKEAYAVELERRLLQSNSSADQANQKLLELQNALGETEFLKKAFGSELKFGGEDGQKFIITKLLGFGGMALVFEAFDKDLQRKVAIKVPLPHMVYDPRFSLTEMRNQAKIRHNRVVAVDTAGIMPKETYEKILRTTMGNLLKEIQERKGAVDYQGGETENEQSVLYLAQSDWVVSIDTIPFMVMEYVEDGKTIEDILQGSNFPIPLDRALKWVFDVAQTLWTLRTKKSIIHRDIKPSNLFVVNNGEMGGVKIADFGISKRIDEGAARKASGDGLTKVGETPGTPIYMPIEQVCGDDATINERVDIHALGVTFYEMLTRRLPYRMPTGGTVGGAANPRIKLFIEMRDKAPSPPNEGAFPGANPVPDDVSAVIMRAIAKDALDRYQNWHDFCQDLLRLCRFYKVPVTIDEELRKHLG